MRRLVFLCGVLLVLAASLALLQLQPRVPAPSGTPVATLLVLTGSAQLTRAGAATAVIARGGDALRPGDRVTTGPGTRAVVRYATGDQARLDSGSIAIIDAAGLRLSAGRCWARDLSGGELEISSAGKLTRLTKAGQEVGVVAAGSTGSEPDSPWTVLNRALDLDPSPAGPGALGEGTLLPGEESAAQQAATVNLGGPAQSLYFSADWTAGNLELEIIDPEGAVFDQVAGPARPVSLVVPQAAAGGWEYRVRQLAGGEEGNSWFVVISQLPK